MTDEEKREILEMLNQPTVVEQYPVLVKQIDKMFPVESPYNLEKAMTILTTSQGAGKARYRLLNAQVTWLKGVTDMLLEDGFSLDDIKIEKLAENHMRVSAPKVGPYEFSWHECGGSNDER